MENKTKEYIIEIINYLKEKHSLTEWEFDERYNTAVISFEVELADEIFSFLKDKFTLLWDKKSIKKASDSLKTLSKYLSGIQSSQYLLNTEENPILFGAWWPWKNNKDVSLRIGIFPQEDSGFGEEKVLAIIKDVFNFK